MPGTNETLSLFTRKIQELEAQRTRLEEQITVLKAAYATFADPVDVSRPQGIRARRKRGVRAARPAPRRKVDKQAREHTLAFMKSVDGPTTPEMVAEKFGIKYSAANQRLHTYTLQGDAQRIGPGKYIPVGDADSIRTTVAGGSEAGAS